MIKKSLGKGVQNARYIKCLLINGLLIKRPLYILAFINGGLVVLN